jgi:DeoR/GlpR family transcriptional regulator of sugar metabolism
MLIIVESHSKLSTVPTRRADAVDGPSTRPAPILARQRQARILQAVQQGGGVRVGDLAVALGVSDMTIRRDLAALARRGLLDKVHGGATKIDQPGRGGPAFEAGPLRAQLEKTAVAVRAARLVQPGCSVGLTAGSTTRVLAHQLIDVPRLTIVTNSIPVADVLHLQHRPDRSVILVGGLRTPAGALVGPLAVQTLRSLHVDLLFMGVHGFTVAAGLTSPSVVEAETQRAFAEAARRLVVIADHTKWGIVGLSRIVQLGQVDTVVVDDGLAAPEQRLLREQVGELIVAKTRRGSRRS